MVRKLLAGSGEVIVLVRDAAKYQALGAETVLQGNLSNPGAWEKTLKSSLPDTCIHLAWEGIPDYSYTVSSRNLTYGLNMLHACETAGIGKIVMTGSCWEYARPKGGVLVGAPLEFEKPFCAAKNSFRIMAHSFCREREIDMNWLRLFYVYGPGQRQGSLIPYIIKCLRDGRSPKLSGAYNKNDFVYVGDVADAIVKAANSYDLPELMNVGAGKSESVLSVAKKVADVMGVPLDTGRYTRPVACTDFFADADEMRRTWQWRPGLSLEDGIRAMVQAA